MTHGVDNLTSRFVSGSMMVVDATLGSIRNLRLGQTLRARLRATPRVAVHEGCRVERLAVERDRVTGVPTTA